MRNCIFSTQTGYLELINAAPRHIKHETTGEGTELEKVALGELRQVSQELLDQDTATETLQIVDDEVVVVPRPVVEKSQAEKIGAVWESLSDDDKANVYTYAPNAILAWEREEMSVMIKLILANDAPQIADLKEVVKMICATKNPQD